MHTEPIPSFDEFRAWVLAAYAPLMRSMGFVELPGRQGKGVTCFTVRLQNATTIIEVEGIHYGTAAWTKVFRASDKEETGAGLPIYRLLQLRQGLTAKQHRRRNRQGQLAEVEETAAAIIKHAGDVLLGDFSELERLAETERLLQRKRLEKRFPEKRKRRPSPRRRRAMPSNAATMPRSSSCWSRIWLTFPLHSEGGTRSRKPDPSTDRAQSALTWRSQTSRDFEARGFGKRG